MEHKCEDQVRKDIPEELDIHDETSIFGGKVLYLIVLDHDYDSPDQHQGD